MRFVFKKFAIKKLLEFFQKFLDQFFRLDFMNFDVSRKRLLRKNHATSCVFKFNKASHVAIKVRFNFTVNFPLDL